MEPPLPGGQVVRLHRRARQGPRLQRHAPGMRRPAGERIQFRKDLDGGAGLPRAPRHGADLRRNACDVQGAHRTAAPHARRRPMKKRTAPPRHSLETGLIHGKSKTKKWDFNHHVVPPISSSCTFRLDTAKRGAQGFAEFAHHVNGTHVESRAPIYVYDRLGEPNKEVLEENLAAAEHGDIAVTFSTGMAAISAVFGSLTGGGDEILAHRVLYGCTYSLLTNWYPRYRIATNFIDMNDPGEL